MKSSLIKDVQTVLAVLEKSTDWLESKGVERARLDAELLMAHVLDCGRLDLYLQFDRPLDDEQLESLRGYVRRRGGREPLQYITGHAGFCDLVLKCDSRALIPRPETEGLVDLILKKFSAADVRPPARVLDLGTGTGAIGLALASAWADAEVVAVDASKGALALARENAVANELDDRVRLVESDWLTNVEGRFDLIVANPPYLTKEEMSSAAPEVTEHEPLVALVSGADGLNACRVILSQAKEHLNPGGLLALETGINHHDALSLIAQAEGFTNMQSIKDIHVRSRYFLVNT